jgi:hypothetical protein
MEGESADGGAGIDAVGDRDEVHRSRSKIFKGRHQVSNGASEPIELPDQDHVHLAPPNVGHEPVKLWPSILRTRLASVNELTDDFPSPLMSDTTKLLDLHGGILVVG